MTREEIIEMLNWHPSHARTHGESGGLLSRIERVVAVAVAAEREACAQILERNAEVCISNSMLHDALVGNALAIRARGEE